MIASRPGKLDAARNARTRYKGPRATHKARLIALYAPPSLPLSPATSHNCARRVYIVQRPRPSFFRCYSAPRANLAEPSALTQLRVMEKLFYRAFDTLIRFHANALKCAFSRAAARLRSSRPRLSRFATAARLFFIILPLFVFYFHFQARLRLPAA